ncbi:non-hydrolyzing UDP-N-acetylglucosamine 2-epimerase [Burkholderia ubonensis]|uniref:non-hydrolyzing UDP-N-acetylglucosamine 2-epimerase n=1 Tax=Burkholderia ubonensis TaxID=101571 RepID=UPI000F5665E4|nr:UDP-N-acetylglucosamine 2-epimerase (non-hydrolyzing) [Burkholderia ubonensis]RQP42280.1 UDP-N-acetylglucosamine 2-epimerase (non-hydrolyzing) [Burkholderia ubonensis]RQP42535.1 UDP-N-acetylglucosamine 2-epimerase (non-hydrolyzing) [Burkholderia ubonensis]RQP45783.1 UDP-N-acetylglucosamine 2-epimerase (non-hydrolyzing) [Burkholderia ubonensis]RQP56146.1 UDP-N-acetylglucosamine 2-epimerase (non-hydrolyzing) [Burkholderia ubonensis]RQP63083.1 UDP-N-acetylglucosamine 2-epimerase (non-hydrolyzi
MKVMVVLGTRPEVIKLAPVIEALRAKVETVVCASGQHREMLAQALEFFGIEPDVSVNTMSPGESLNILSARLLTEMDGVLERVRPDWVLVQGDTTTAFCAGLAAFHRGIPVGHVEAGLRTGDLANPFPEEANRSLLGRIVSRHFAPTQLARQNLLREGVDDSKIVVTGNTVVDAILLARKSWESAPASLELPKWDGPEQLHILVTCHRRENFGETLLGICQVLRNLCRRYAGHQWVFPVHLNPAVRKPVMRELGDIPNLVLLPPVDYASSLYLISRSALVVSDSGGIQEEAPTFGVPVVVMRSHTERREGVDAGFATLAGQTPEHIEAAAVAWLDDPERRAALRNRANPYGDGRASERLVANLLGQRIEVFGG